MLNKMIEIVFSENVILVLSIVSLIISLFSIFDVIAGIKRKNKYIAEKYYRKIIEIYSDNFFDYDIEFLLKNVLFNDSKIKKYTSEEKLENDLNNASKKISLHRSKLIKCQEEGEFSFELIEYSKSKESRKYELNVSYDNYPEIYFIIEKKDKLSKYEIEFISRIIKTHYAHLSECRSEFWMNKHKNIDKEINMDGAIEIKSAE